MRLPRSRAALLVGLSVSLVLSSSGRADEPRRTKITEEVDVELFLLDVTVTDRRLDIVTGLGIDDFSLKIDDRKTPIVSLDLNCPEPPREDPAAVSRGLPPTQWLASDRPRRIVLALDYRHLERIQRAQVLEEVRDAVRRLHGAQEELMIVALADFLRIEHAFSTDRDAALAALDRMEQDITLWEPPFSHLHDAVTFESLFHLVDLLGTAGGDKVVVLYSNWPSSSAPNDSSYAELSARSARARVSFYTVWTRGLTPRGTSRQLARLAVETGGRFTERTNDLALGYSRAQRDMNCRYTVGFYDPDPQRARPGRIVLRVKRRGVHAYHHSTIARADPEARRKQLAAAAIAWPQNYLSPTINLVLRPLRPLGRKRWEVLLAAEERSTAGEDVRIETRIRRGNAVWSRAAQNERIPFSTADSYRLRSGTYEAAVIVSASGQASPGSALTTLELPELTGNGWWLSEPLLLQTPVPAAQSAAGAESLFDGRIPVLGALPSGREYAVIAELCRYGAQARATQRALTLELHGSDRVPFVVSKSMDYGAGSGVQCQGFTTLLPDLSSGSYSIVLSVGSAKADPRPTQATLELLPPAGQPGGGSNERRAR